MVNNRNFQKSLVTLFVFSFAFSFFGRPAHAQICKTEDCVFSGFKTWMHEKAEEVIPDLDISRTVQSILIETTTGFLASLVLDRNLDEVSNCFAVAQDIYPASNDRNYVHPQGPSPVLTIAALQAQGADPGKIALAQSAWANVTNYDPTVCDFDGNHMVGGVGESAGPVVYRGSGSMLAVASSLRHSAVNEPLPVNMAFFLRDYARRIPLVKNTAFAQTTVNYNFIGGEAVYDIWEIVRNVALGLMSIVLLVVGVMIMTRKKINAQAVVTVQNVLPRVALGIVLVFFSYPIGAFFAALLYPLSETALGIIFTLMGQSSVTGNLNVLLYSSFYPVQSDPRVGVGLFAVFTALLMLIVSIVIFIIVLIRALLIYVKVLLNIIVAPIQFTLGVLPGKESATLDWFKNMAADVLSAPAMFLMMSIAWVFGYVSFAGALVDLSTMDPSNDGLGISRIITSFFTPVVMIFCLITALKMPGKVQKMIMGDKRR